MPMDLLRPSPRSLEATPVADYHLFHANGGQHRHIFVVHRRCKRVRKQRKRPVDDLRLQIVRATTRHGNRPRQGQHI